MNQFMIDNFNLFTTLGILRFFTGLLLVIVLSSLFYYYKTGSKKLLIVSVISQLFSLIIFTLVTSLASELFLQITNGYNQISLITILLLNNLSLALYTSEYLNEMSHKRPDPDRVNRSHFKSTIDQIAILLVLGLGIGLFTTVELTQVILTIALTTTIVLMINMFVFMKVFVDNQDN